MRRRFDAILRLRDAMEQSVADSATKETFTSPRAVRHEDRFPSDVVIRVVHKQSERLVDVGLDDVVKVPFAAEDAACVADDPVSEGNETCRHTCGEPPRSSARSVEGPRLTSALCRRAFEDFEDVPDLQVPVTLAVGESYGSERRSSHLVERELRAADTEAESEQGRLPIHHAGLSSGYCSRGPIPRRDHIDLCSRRCIVRRQRWKERKITRCPRGKNRQRTSNLFPLRAVDLQRYLCTFVLFEHFGQEIDLVSL